MTDFTLIDLNNLLPGEPWTSAKATVVYENPIAIAEGAVDAPKVQGQGLAAWIGRVVSSAGTPAGFTDLDRAKDILVLMRQNGTGIATVGQLRFSDDNGSTWGSWQNLTDSAASGERSQVTSVIDLTTGAQTTIGLMVGGIPGALTIPAGCNAIQARGSNGADCLFGLGILSGVA